MATLLAIRGPLTGTRVTIGEEAVLIGRSTTASINLPDATVSRSHALIKKQRLGFVLEDLDSAAGTYLNNQLIKTPVALAPNDEIRIGHTIFLFDSDFDLQNADFTDNSVFFATASDETMSLPPVATLDPKREVRDGREEDARSGLELIGEIGNLFDGSRVPLGEAIRATMERLARLFASDVALLLLHDKGLGQLRVTAAIASGNVLADSSLLRRVFHEKKSMLVSDKPELEPHPSPEAPRQAPVRSLVAAPLLMEDVALGVICFERQELDAYTLKDLRVVQSLAKLLAVFIETRQRSEAAVLRQNYQAIDSPVVGTSATFAETMEMVRKVAPTPASVLLVGETGTGKEILAAEIHRLSEQGREGRPFIAVNCAAIPESLFESELFGHEKGSFTGAHRMRQGYIEQAQGGTLFLDEIGELSLAVQPKLLRFLQEHTFTRVGGNRIHRADVRVIAATNRQLLDEVAAARFREDLYHRLSVFTIPIPPLRHRVADIRLLTEYFVQKFNRSLNRRVLAISEDVFQLLQSHPWPGNIRELANCLERAVLLCDGDTLLPRHILLMPSRGSTDATNVTQLPGLGQQRIEPAKPLRPLAEVEREHILAVLAAADGNQVRAAEILGIHRNTLRNKLQEYGV